METRILKDMIAVIKAEQLRREEQLDNVDPSYQNDQWLFTDVPFVNELYLMIVVALRHQVERELVKIAARIGYGGKEISGQDYVDSVQNERRRLLLRKKDGGGWEQLAKRLKLQQCAGYEHMEVLRLLANAYKHDPWMEPSKELLKRLNLKTDVKYAPLPGGTKLQQGLAQYVGLGKDAPCCDTAARFVDVASEFLETVKEQTALSPIKWGRVSLNDSLH
jgi:hypothetical protein